jgi:hypothetical protein
MSVPPTPEPQTVTMHTRSSGVAEFGAECFAVGERRRVKAGDVAGEAVVLLRRRAGHGLRSITPRRDHGGDRHRARAPHRQLPRGLRWCRAAPALIAEVLYQHRSVTHATVGSNGRRDLDVNPALAASGFPAQLTIIEALSAESSNDRPLVKRPQGCRLCGKPAAG